MLKFGITFHSPKLYIKQEIIYVKKQKCESYNGEN